MKYAREVMELMAGFPGRDFRRVDIVRYLIGAKPDPRRRKRVEEAVRQVLKSLTESGAVEVTPAQGNGSFALYRWKNHQMSL